MDDLSKLVCLMFGFKEFGTAGYPCHWCGVPTPLLDAEDFHVCEGCQLLHIEVGYEEMKKKYPLAGKEERNPTFFKERTDRNVARAKLLTKQELTLIVQRGSGYARDEAQKALDDKTLTEHELDNLGSWAEQYIDHWREG